ncbi:hypothetical protein E2320_017730 [Naja naja]|nr:hypothetical protein E2320_017730 [Naja naja]
MPPCDFVPEKYDVQTGFGRMGSHFWGFEGHDVVPDIVTMAKGIGNGFPMGAVVTTPEIARSLTENLHFNTFGGNPVACAVGSAVLDAIAEDGLQKNCQEIGTHLLLEFAKLRDTFESVGDVRGKGLMIGIEMVKNKETREPLPADEMDQIWEDCKDMGLLIGKGGMYLQVGFYKSKEQAGSLYGQSGGSSPIYETKYRHKQILYPVLHRFKCVSALFMAGPSKPPSQLSHAGKACLSLGQQGAYGCDHNPTVLEAFQKPYLFLRFSFLLLLLTAVLAVEGANALACPVVFRCSNNLFRD